MKHLTTAELEAALETIRQSPKDGGLLHLIVRRPAENTREVLPVGELDTRDGLVGDTWRSRNSSRTADGSPHPDMQLNIMNARVAALVAQEPGRWPLAGDQLYLDLDLSDENLPAGTQLAIGSAVVQVTDQPHTGCKKFVDRFGLDAMKFVNSPVGRQLHLRGINARVVRPGVIRPGDLARKLGDYKVGKLVTSNAAVISLALGLVVSYLLGSIPTSIWVGRAARGVDVREHGSLNAGATNTYRVLGWRLALIVALVDLGKGFVATRFVGTWAPVEPLPWSDPVHGMLLCGLVAVLGHIWTVFAGFRGGKGVLTAAGLLLALAPVEMLICLGLFILVVKATGYVSLGSITAAVAYPLLVVAHKLLFDPTLSRSMVGVSVVLGALIVFTHRANIRRLLSGTELRFGQKNPESAPAADPSSHG